MSYEIKEIIISKYSPKKRKICSVTSSKCRILNFN